MDDPEHVRQKMPEGVGLRPACQRLRHGVQEGHATLGIRGDHRVADTGERDPKPLRLLTQRLLGAPARDEDALGVLQGGGAKPCLFVAFGAIYLPFSRSLREPGPFDARADLRERGLAGRRGVVAEWREPAVVARAELRDRNVFGGLEHAVAHLLRRLDPRIDRIDDADEHHLVRLEVVTNDLEHADADPVSPARAT